MSMAFRGQPQYAQSPMGGYNMSGYGGDAMQAFGDIGGFGGFGALSGPATMGGNYSMFGSYNPMPYQQQSYTGGYVPGYGAQLPQQFGGYGGYGGYGGFGGGFGGFGGGYGGFGMPQQPQQNVNDLFGQYMFGQYYGQPAFNPFQATSMFGGGRRGGGFGGGFGGGRRGSREQFQQQPPVPLPRQPNFGRFGQTSQPAPTPTPTPSAPAPGSSRDLFYQDMINAGLSADAALQATNQRYGGGASPAPAPAPAPTNTPNTAQPLYSTANDNWGMGLPFDYTQVPANFNWQAYLDAPGNADLRAAGVDTPSEAAKHYLNYGINENRSLGGAAQAAASAPTPAPAAPVDSRPIVADIIGPGGQMVSYGDVDQFGSLVYVPVAPAPQPAATQAVEQALPYYGGQIDMGGLPLFVDNYAGLYPNRFSMF